MLKTAEQLIVDIIKNKLELGDNRVWVRNQNKTIPPDNGLFVVVGMTDSRPLSSQIYLTEESEALPDPLPPIVRTYEISRVQTVDNIQIDLFSRDNSAITRRWEIIGALKSIFSQQVQEDNYFKISKLPLSFINTSAAEGGSNLNRFSLTFSCFVWAQTKKQLTETGGDYYDQFDTRVDDAKTIGTIEPIIYLQFSGEGAGVDGLGTENNDAISTENGDTIAITGMNYLSVNITDILATQDNDIIVMLK